MLNTEPRRSATHEVAAVRKALEVFCQSTARNLVRTLECYDFVGPRVYELGLHVSNRTRLVASVNYCAGPSKSCFGQIAGFHTQSNLPRQVQLTGRIMF